MNENLFHLFPGEPFLDLNLYQCGSEQCAPCYSYGPVAEITFSFTISYPEREFFTRKMPEAKPAPGLLARGRDL